MRIRVFFFYAKRSPRAKRWGNPDLVAPCSKIVILYAHPKSNASCKLNKRAIKKTGLNEVAYNFNSYRLEQ